MRHRKSGRPLGRNSAHRRALYRNLVTSFLQHGRIETTEAKAKELRPIAERLISLGKRGDLHVRRMAASYIFNRSVTTQLFSDIAPRFIDQNGGYTRLLKTRIRKGDASQMTVLELTKTESIVEDEKEKGKKKVKEKKKEGKAS
ncbi:MAG: 50S ribosomal protein L17 [Nitrospiria bacterium]